MDCACGGYTKVLDTRQHPEGGIWRRRKCKVCGDVFTTLEVNCLTNRWFTRAVADPKLVRKSVDHPKTGQPKPIKKKEHPVSVLHGTTKKKVDPPAKLDWVRRGKSDSIVPTKHKPKPLPEFTTMDAEAEDLARIRIEDLKELRALEKLDGYPED